MPEYLARYRASAAPRAARSEPRSAQGQEGGHHQADRDAVPGERGEAAAETKSSSRRTTNSADEKRGDEADRDHGELSALMSAQFL